MIAGKYVVEWRFYNICVLYKYIWREKFRADPLRKIGRAKGVQIVNWCAICEFYYTVGGVPESSYFFHNSEQCYSMRQIIDQTS